MGLMGIIYNCRLLPEFQSLLQAVKSWVLLVPFLDHFASHFFSLALDVKDSFGNFLLEKNWFSWFKIRKIGKKK